MSPDLYFALTLIVKMVVTAAFVLAATVTAERAGPLIGGLVATLPLGAGPVYVFFALDHDAPFIAQSAVNSLAINAINVIFALVYALLAQKRSFLASFLPALLSWFVLAFIVHKIAWTLPAAVTMNVVVLTASIVIARPLRHVRIPGVRARWYDLALRAAMVAMLVGLSVTMSFRIGPNGSGILAVFPIILISIMLILHRRVGGPATAAVMANGILGLVGFAFACVSLNLSAEALGSFPGLALALSISIGWGLLVLAARRRGIPV